MQRTGSSSRAFIAPTAVASAPVAAAPTAVVGALDSVVAAVAHRRHRNVVAAVVVSEVGAGFKAAPPPSADAVEQPGFDERGEAELFALEMDEAIAAEQATSPQDPAIFAAESDATEVPTAGVPEEEPPLFKTQNCPPPSWRLQIPRRRQLFHRLLGVVFQFFRLPGWFSA